MIKAYRLFLICVSMCFSVILSPVHGQSIDQKIGLKELIDRVNAQSLFLTPDSAAILIRRAQQQAVPFNRLPSFILNAQANVGTNNNMPGGYFSYGVVPGNSKVRSEGNSSSILTDLAIASVNWDLYDFGENKAQQRVAASNVDVEQSRFQQSKYNLQAFVIDNYIQWLQIEDLLSIQAKNIERNTEIRQSIMALAKSGIKAGVDTSIAEAEISKARLNYLELKGQRDQFKLTLSAITNVPVEQLYPDTAYLNKLVLFQSNVPGGDSARDHHPLLQYYQSLHQNSLEKELLLKKSYFPTLSLQGAVWGRGSSISANNDAFRKFSSGLPLERGNYLVGVGITYNLFDIKKKQLQLKIQQATTNYAEQQLQQQQMMLTLSEHKLEAQLNTARERLDEIPHQLAAAQAAYRQKRSLYKNGLTDILDLNAALYVLYRAETDLIAAKYQYTKTLFEKAITDNQVPSLLQFTK